jgi:hypothetical protein
MPDKIIDHLKHTLVAEEKGGYFWMSADNNRGKSGRIYANKKGKCHTGEQSLTQA